MTNYVASYITLAEYSCNHCQELPAEFDRHDDVPEIYNEFFDAFSVIRNEWGKPIPISSGYRCPLHNSNIGGSLLSVHLFGLALDMDCECTDDVDTLSDIVNDLFPDLRMGKYKDAGTFIHIDVGYLINPRASHTWRRGKRWFG